MRFSFFVGVVSGAGRGGRREQTRPRPVSLKQKLVATKRTQVVGLKPRLPQLPLERRHVLARGPQQGHGAQLRVLDGLGGGGSRRRRRRRPAASSCSSSRPGRQVDALDEHDARVGQLAAAHEGRRDAHGLAVEQQGLVSRHVGRGLADVRAHDGPEVHAREGRRRALALVVGVVRSRGRHGARWDVARAVVLVSVPGGAPQGARARARAHAGARERGSWREG